MNHHKHKVVSYHWENGIIQAREKFFETLEEAIALVEALEYYSAKIFFEDQVIMAFNGIQINSYIQETYA